MLVWSTMYPYYKEANTKFSAIQKTHKNHGNWIQNGKCRKTAFVWLKKIKNKKNIQENH